MFRYYLQCEMILPQDRYSTMIVAELVGDVTSSKLKSLQFLLSHGLLSEETMLCTRNKEEKEYGGLMRLVERKSSKKRIYMSWKYTVRTCQA